MNNILHKSLYFPLTLPLSLLLISPNASAFQLDITSVNTTLATGTSQTVNGITYAGNVLSVDSFTVDGVGTWGTATPATSYVRRFDHSAQTDDRNVVWGEQNTGITDLLSPLPTTTENALNGNNLYLGSDNIFVNTGNTSGNQSSIERIDYIFDSPTVSSSIQGFAVFERGTSTGHDKFQVALVLGVDGSNQPTAFSDPIIINPGWGATDLATIGSGHTVLNDSSGLYDDTSDISGQNIGGVVISLDQFQEQMATINTNIYGYSLFGGDVAVDGSGEINPDWTTYPLSNEGSTQAGLGLDPVALNFGLVEQVPFKFSPSLGLLLAGGGFLGLRNIKQNSAKNLNK